MKKLLPIFIVLLCFISISTQAQYTKLFDFTSDNDLASPQLSEPVFDGTWLYAMTNLGGTSNLGTIYKVKPDGSEYTKLLDFTGAFNGSNPYGSLLLSGGVLYGMTRNGGASGLGCIFSINTDGSGYYKMLDFTGAANGSGPYGSLIISGGILYGMTFSGGSTGSGCIFKINPDGSGYTKIFDFTGAGTGIGPEGSLSISGDMLFGMTRGGGTAGCGAIFKVKTDGSGFVRLYSFPSMPLGCNPYGSLTLNGNLLYGMTNSGGVSDMGMIFKIDTVGAGYTTLYQFSGASNGSNPFGSLVINGADMYGMTSSGGANNLGCIFKILTSGSGYTKMMDFSGATNGSTPYGSFALSGSTLYGMTALGGANNSGCLFKINTDGSGFSKILDCGGALYGSKPYGSLCVVGTELFGMTYLGGNEGKGCIFKINSDGTGFTNMYSFSGTSNGSKPYGSLIVSGGILYGMTNRGGTSDAGCIFSINTNGTGYTKLLDFTGVATGSYPYGSLTLDGGILYGMTNQGGASGFGCIFKINTNGTGFSKLLDFTGVANGGNPYGSLTISGGVMYGMTNTGGSSNTGCLFSMNTNGTGYAKLLDFTGIANGSYPYGSLTLSAGVLYGMTYSGGGGNKGTVFSINTNGTGYTTLLGFSGTATGSYPYGSLALYNNKLYGVTNGGGAATYGCIFKIDCGGTGYSRLFSFTGAANGSFPYYSLHAFNGSLYGMTNTGGTSNIGVIYKYALTPEVQVSNINTSNITSNSADISWTNGDGEKRVVFMKEGAGAITNPTNLSTYTASSNWSSKGSQLGTSGYYCIYNGSGSSVSVSNLAPATLYTIQAFEYNGNPAAEQYYTATATNNPNTFTSLQLSQSINFTPFTTPLVYGAAAFNLTANATSGLTVSFSSSDPSVATIVGNLVTITGVGSTIITASQAGNALYFPASDVPLTLVVTKAMLTATADNKSKFYGDANPPLTISYSGFVYSENSGVIDTPPTASTGATVLSPVGSYPINVSGGLDNNYDFTLVSGTLTVNRATINATGDNKSRDYGDANPSLTISYSGFRNGDTISDLDVLPTVSTTATVLSPAGTYTIMVVGGVDNNYMFMDAIGTLTINKATLTATADNKSRDYGDANPPFTIAYSGFKNSENSGVIDVLPTATTTATVLSPVGSYPITIAGGSDNNYTFTYVAGTLTIGKVTLTATADNKSRDYGDANPPFTITYSGFKNSENSGVIDVLPTASTAATVLSPVGSYPITVAGGSDNNYTFTYVAGTLTIGKATLTATADNKSRDYGDANPPFTIAYSGFKNSENSGVIDVLPTASTAATILSPVGSYPITVAGGSDNNYTFTYVAGTLTIGKATLTATADNKSRDYGDANPPFTIAYSGFKNSENSGVIDVLPTASTAATILSPVGSYPITVAGGSDNNYTFNYVAGTLTIGKATLTATADNKSRDYGDANPPFTITYSGFKNSENSGVIDVLSTASTAATVLSPVGSYPITVAGGSDNNYTFTFVAGTLTIGKATLLATADNKSRDYGDANPLLTITYSGFKNSENSGVIDVLPTASTAATVLSPVGSYPITVAGGSDNNYTFTYVAGTLSIGKATLMATADNKSRDYGDANPPLTITYSGFKNSENSGVIDVLPTASTAATILSPVGSYPITVAGGSDNNYTFTYVDGTLTIGKATLTATADDKTKEYGNPNPPLTISYSGFAGSDGPADLNVQPTASTAALLLSPVGNYPITVSGGSDDNYDFIYVSGNLQITKVILTVTAKDTSKTYGSVNPPLMFTYSGFVGSDGPGILETLPTASTIATDFSPAGNYAITVSGGVDDYYDFAYVAGNLLISKITLTATANDTNKVYGTVNPAFTYYYSGFIGTDGPGNIDTDPTEGSTAGTFSPVGIYPITLSGGLDDCYDFSYIPANLTITKAMLTAIADNQSKAYGDPNPVLTITYIGFAGTDDTAVIDTLPLATTTAVLMSPVGNYVISLNGGWDNNYNFTLINDTLEITKAFAFIIITDTIQYYDGNPKPVTTATNPIGLTVDVLYNGSSVVPSAVGTYTVLATIDELNYQGTKSSTLEILLDVSVNNPTGNSVHIYSDFNNIYVDFTGTYGFVIVYDITGSCIYKSGLLNSGVNILSGNFSTGVYFVRLQTDNCIYIKKVLLD
jgi:uncharacterized repeat protein (TIGR03803 family)